MIQKGIFLENFSRDAPGPPSPTGMSPQTPTPHHQNNDPSSRYLWFRHTISNGKNILVLILGQEIIKSRAVKRLVK